MAGFSLSFTPRREVIRRGNALEASLLRRPDGLDQAARRKLLMRGMERHDYHRLFGTRPILGPIRPRPQVIVVRGMGKRPKPSGVTTRPMLWARARFTRTRPTRSLGSPGPATEWDGATIG